MWLPLEASGGSVGTLFVSYEEPQVFDERERAELQVVADQVALALERSLLQQAREEAVRLSARVERVKAVSGAMTPTSVSRRSRPRSSWRRLALGAVAGGIAVAKHDETTLDIISRIGGRMTPLTRCRSTRRAR